MMVLRIVQFLLGAAFVAGGAYLAWTQRAEAANIFPPGPAGLPLMLVGGVLGLAAGVVLLTSALHPRPNQRRMAAEKAAREDAALQAADTYYSERARAADRDWRSGAIPIPAQAGSSETVAEPVLSPEPVAPEPVKVMTAPPPDPAPVPRAPIPRSFSAPPPARPVGPPAAPPAPAAAPPAAPKSTAKPRTVAPSPAPQSANPAPSPAAPAAAARGPAPPQPKPVAPSQAKPGASNQPVNGSASPFPADITLAPIPRAQEPLPPSTRPVAPPAPMAAAQPNDPHAAIRAAIASGNLDDADKMLASARDAASGMELAQLTALAGDHAAVSGRQSHAKWLWRLALKRFGELNAMNSPAAKAVAESLRQAG